MYTRAKVGCSTPMSLWGITLVGDPSGVASGSRLMFRRLGVLTRGPPAALKTCFWKIVQEHLYSPGLVSRAC